MINSTPERDDVQEKKQLGPILRKGPIGALALAGIATAVVIAIWFAFYLVVFIPRGPLY